MVGQHLRRNPIKKNMNCQTNCPEMHCLHQVHDNIVLHKLNVYCLYNKVNKQRVFKGEIIFYICFAFNEILVFCYIFWLLWHNYSEYTNQTQIEIDLSLILNINGKIALFNKRIMQLHKSISFELAQMLRIYDMSCF